MGEELPSIIFTKVPIPPSSNSQYSTLIRKNRPIHVPSLSLNQFRKAMTVYFSEHKDLVKVARDLFEGNRPLSVQCHFAFEYSRIFTKAGNFKRLDVSNRLKALHDVFAVTLGIDDSCFVHISAAKYPVDKKEDEGCIVEIQLVPEIDGSPPPTQIGPDDPLAG